MAKINGTLLLIYVDGVLIASQQECTLNLSVDLPDISTKDDEGWAKHMNGQRSFEVSIDGLVSTTGLSAAGLLAYIESRTNLLLVIEGAGTYFSEASITSVELSASKENPIALSGSMKGTGAVYRMVANMITDINDTDTYDTFTPTADDLGVSSAIDAGGGADDDSNAISITDAHVYKFVTFLTLNSGEAPSVGLWDSTSAYISNQVQLAVGLNIVTLLATATDGTSTLRIENTGACNFALTTCYLCDTD